MRNFTILNTTLAILFFVLECSAQLTIGVPNLGFSQACASPSFNTYTVGFIFSPNTGLDPTNQFIIELSDPSGSFASPTVIYTSPEGSINSSPAELTFQVPTTIAGEAYKIRIKSTVPASTSSSSRSFSAYYKIHDTPFTINNLISTGVFCSGGSYLLTIDNPGSDTNDSPLQYESLTFNWFRETGPTTSVFVESGDNLTVTQPGTYFAETNYGSCTSNSFSNRVTITQSDTNVTSEISSSLGNPYCASEGDTTLSAISGITYQWYKDNDEIPTATEQTLVTNEPGNYSVTVDLGGCTTTASIDLINNSFTSEIDVNESIKISEGESITATVTDNAINPEYEWYFNDNIIETATTNSYEANEFGTYKVVIKQNSECEYTREHTFTISEQFSLGYRIPNLISPNNDGYNDTWIIPEAYVSGTNTNITILNAQGKVVLETNDYFNDWPQAETIDFKEVNPIYYYIIAKSDTEVLKGSITVIK